MDGYHALMVAVTQFFLGGYVLLLTDLRPPQRTWRRRWLAAAILVVCANLVSILVLDYWTTYTRTGVLTVTLPYILITLWCSRHRDMRAVFGIATALFVGCVGSANGILVEEAVSQPGLLPIAARAATFALLFFLLRQFSGTYRAMLRQLEHGWTVLCLIPVVTFLIMLYINNALLPAAPFPMMAVIYGLLAVCGGTYYLMYLFFQQVEKERDVQNSRRLLEMQVSALRSRIEAVDAAEEALRIERHDLRHRLNTIAALVGPGERERVQAYLGAAQARLEEAAPQHWCNDPLLNATFSSYFEQARRGGIQVEARLAFPEPLPVDAAGLSVLFANALENAIHACQALPEGERRIICRSIGRPSLMLEVANPVAGPVPFGEDGFPVPSGGGHGVGLRSIREFCRQNGALASCTCENGWFSLRVAF